MCTAVGVFIRREATMCISKGKKASELEGRTDVSMEGESHLGLKGCLFTGERVH